MCMIFIVRIEDIVFLLLGINFISYNMVKKIFREGTCSRVVATLFLFNLAFSQANAQNVTIKATNGSMMASTPQGSSEYDTFYKCGGFATWQHEQLSMALTASDATSLTSSGQLANPANNLFSDGTHIQIAKGAGNSNQPTCYLALSLPKGYRFTGYTIVFAKEANVTKSYGGNGGTTVTFNNGNTSSTFGETGSDFSTYITSANVTYSRSYDLPDDTITISRTATDMDNVLYFKLYNQNNTSERALITIISAEFFFSAEADYKPLITPGDFQRVSAIDIPFSTSKIDYGTIENRDYNGVTRTSYNSSNVRDLTANFTFYEAESIVDGTNFDGTTGKVVEYKEGSISVEDGYYRIGAEDASNPGEEEHIYYLETPSYVMLSDNATKNPIGFRIVGAQIDYKYGPTNIYGETSTNTYNTFNISGRAGNGYNYSTYYLNSAGGATKNQSDQASWYIDNDGYIRTGANGSTYLTTITTGGNTNATTTVNKNDAVKFSIDSGHIYYTKDDVKYWMRCESSNGFVYFRFNSSTNNRITITNSGSTTVNVSEITGTRDATPYILKVYGKDGVTSTTYEVTEDGSATLEGLNNDAIKIGVIGTGLIQGTLTLQALDPYMDNMQVVCNDTKTDPVIRVTQSFTASDFSVNGGQFIFHLPDECMNHEVSISFEELTSKYFDETYDGGSASHYSRINFVKSDHYNEFGMSNNNLYDNISEAADAQQERLKINIVGTKAFTFNNAKEIGVSSDILFTEYPFSLENYATSDEGSFDSMSYTVSQEDQELTRYVFTTDETRYNIAPTTAIQHRAYAYYEMEVHVVSSTYTPEIRFTKIYDNTFYAKGDSAFYGVTVTATDNSGNAGRYSINKIIERIDSILTEDKVDDFGNTDLPDRSQQILYLDCSSLAGIYEVTDNQQQSLDNLTSYFATNCMIFLPAGSNNSNNNVSYKLESGEFRTDNNIVLTDKEPFYTPYDIQVADTKYAIYKRDITVPRNGQVTNATLILPFALTVDEEGKHINPDADANPDEACEFSINTMVSSTDAISMDDGIAQEYTGHFTPVTKTEANTPYMIHVISVPEDATNISFIAKEEAAIIRSTASMTPEYLFPGETVYNLMINDDSYTFTNFGGYSGKHFMLSDNPKIFYFANNKYVSSEYLNPARESVKVYPFRTIYDYSDASSPADSKSISGFKVSYEISSDQVTNIENVDIVNDDFKVTTYKGLIRVVSAIDQPIRITSSSGVIIMDVDAKAGETYTKHVPTGIYIINNKKINVK